MERERYSLAEEVVLRVPNLDSRGSDFVDEVIVYDASLSWVLEIRSCIDS